MSTPVRTGLNILIIMTDQERARLGFPGAVALPAHARLRAAGLSFENYHITSPASAPSRAAIWTGQHAPRLGLIDNINVPYTGQLSPSVPTLGHMLRAAGYFTAYKGKWALSRLTGDGADDPRLALEPYGFADFNPEGEVSNTFLAGYTEDPGIAADAAAWLQERPARLGEQPWMLAVSFVNPHDITYFDSDGATGSVQRTAMMDIVEPPDDPLYATNWTPSLPPTFHTQSLVYKPSAHMEYQSLCGNIYGDIPAEREDMWQAHLNYYINCVRDVDRHITTVLDALVESGQAENTVVIFTSDHGEMAAQHGMRQKGGIAYRDVLNAPLIIAHPSGPHGVATNALASAIDLAPTILSLAGVPAARQREQYPQLTGSSMLPLLEDPDLPGPRGQPGQRGRGVLFTFDQYSMIDADWKRRVVQVLGGPQVPNDQKPVHKKPLRTAMRYMREVGSPDLSQRRFYRGIVDGRYKFVRYFAPTNYHLPGEWETLLANNDLELYDLYDDPDEINNLAHVDRLACDPGLLAALNMKLNILIEDEIGDDLPLFKPPPPEQIIEEVSERLLQWRRKWFRRNK